MTSKRCQSLKRLLLRGIPRRDRKRLVGVHALAVRLLREYPREAVWDIGSEYSITMLRMLSQTRENRHSILNAAKLDINT